MDADQNLKRSKTLMFIGVFLIVWPFVLSLIDPVDYNLGQPLIVVLFAASIFGGISSLYVGIKKRRANKN